MHLRTTFLTALALAIALPAAVAAQQKLDRSRPTAVLISGPEVGQNAPAVNLPWASKDTTSDGSFSYNMSRDRGKVVVLAFYPKDFTDGCTAQMRSFAERYDELFGEDVTVLGISTDPLATHQQFARSLSLPFRLLSDPSQTVSARYGAKGSNGLNRRAVYVIGRDGRVAYRDRRFGALDPKAYDRLKEAVQKARADRGPAGR